MKGDFSNWRFDPRDNFAGVLFQQGRVTLDADLTEGELIDLNWQQQAGRDVIGTGIAAVPVAEAEGFQVVSAAVGNEPPGVRLQVQPGRIWADGLLAWLAGDPASPGAPVTCNATYLPAPFNDPVPSLDSIDDEVRDAVILEVSFEEINGYQDPARLIEPALGGPDTAERLHLRTEFRLLRLGDGEDCANIGPRLADDPASRGRLGVTLQPTIVVAGDCPLVAGGGYTGFEHNLYRVEIAQTAGGVPSFKWSQFNGGLVGRGEFHTDQVPNTCTITANATAIVTSGLAQFYLEALQQDASGVWRVVYGAQANLNDAHDLEVDAPAFGSIPADNASVFIRLWNGLRPISDFPATGNPVELRDGIRLAFDAPAAGGFRPGDYWIFTVRAGEIFNEQVLLDQSPPLGPRYHRVPLAEIDWTGRRDTAISGTIEDCRRRFRPLTNQKICCSFLIGDGVTSFGDFNSLEEAATHLPASGGELCLLPGIHFANLVLADRVNVTVHGCPRRSVLLPKPRYPNDPIVHVLGGTGFRLYDVDLVSVRAEAIVVERSERGPARDVQVRDCRVLAGTCCIRMTLVQDVQIARNRVWLLDTPQGKAAISVQAHEALVERNVLGVWPMESRPPRDPGDPGDVPDPADPCLKADVFYAQIPHLLEYSRHLWSTLLVAAPVQPYRAWGGIHLRGDCRNVRVLENRIDGGAGHGITLGGLMPGESLDDEPPEGQGAPTLDVTTTPVRILTQDADAQPVPDVGLFLHKNGAPVAYERSDGKGYAEMKAAPDQYSIQAAAGWRVTQVREGADDSGHFLAAQMLRVVDARPADTGFLDDVTIEENEILRMGLSGIGFRRFREIGSVPSRGIADPKSAVAFLTSGIAPPDLIRTANLVQDLTIRGNRIHDNFRAALDDILRKDLQRIGQGGISLGVVESVVVADNLIHDNGSGSVKPVCGIYVGIGEDLQVTANRITANGAMSVRDGAVEEGLRSGIFVAFATAFVAGGTQDAHQKPALRVEGNRIDQPAGRALTAFAFGPVSCVGNFFNSESVGRWSVIDNLVGAALILDIGGVHRSLRFDASEDAAAPAPETGPAGVNGDFRFVQAKSFEQVMPGGELLFNSNQLRMGPANRALVSHLAVSMDDIGYDGNQSSVFGATRLVANAILAANTLRTSDNRWREESRLTGFSLLSIALGDTAPALSMNTCADNQGDHCIVALGNAARLVKKDNLERDSSNCGRFTGAMEAQKPAAAGVVSSGWATQNVGELDFAQAPGLTQTALAGSMDTLYRHQAARQETMMQESRRIAASEGDDDPRVAALDQRAQGSAELLRQLRTQAEVSSVVPAAVPPQGSVMDGRVLDAANLARAGMRVQIVNADGRPIGPSTTTDASGYYALPLDAATTATLSRESQVMVQVSDAQGRVLQRAPQAPPAGVGLRSRAQLLVPRTAVAPSDVAQAPVVFQRGVPGVPGGGSTPLENIKGFGTVMADRLREAGIADVEALLKTDTARLVEIFGMDARVAVRTPLERIVADSAMRDRLQAAGIHDVEAIAEVDPSRLEQAVGDAPATARLRERAAAAVAAQAAKASAKGPAARGGSRKKPKK